MKEPSITVLKKYLTALSHIKAKYVTTERLSKVVGVYPEVINENLSYFDPLIKMDYEYDVLELVPAIKEYIQEKEEAKIKPIKEVGIKKSDLRPYASINDFVYKKMTIGGMVDRTAHLSNKDLKILKRLINEELEETKKK